MNIPVNFLTWIMAFLPIIVLIVLMIKFHWGATEAAPVGLLITIFSGLLVYKADITTIAVESAKGIWSALVILLIIWTAILMYQVGDEAKAFIVIKEGMSKLLPNELLLVLAMGWIFESFLQGITGFGVPVAVGAPLLIGIGVAPMYAIVIPLLGQAWGNTFGTLGAAWDSLTVSAGIQAGSPEYYRAAFWAAVFLLVWDFATGIIICWLYGKGKAVKKGLPAVLVMTIIGGGGELVLSQVNTTLSNFVPAVICLAVLMLMGRMKMYRDEWRIEDSKIMVRTVRTAVPDDHHRADGCTNQCILEQGSAEHFRSGNIHRIRLRQCGLRCVLADCSVYPCQHVPVPVCSNRIGILQEARLDSGRRNQGNFRPLHHHDHAIRNGSNRTGNHVQDYVRNRTDRRSVSGNCRRAGQ